MAESTIKLQSEASSTGVSENPAINIAHFRHSEVHWPRLTSTLSFNSVQPWFSRPSTSSLPVVILHQAPRWISTGSCPLPGLPFLLTCLDLKFNVKLIYSIPLSGWNSSVVLSRRLITALPTLMPSIVVWQPTFPLLIPPKPKCLSPSHALSSQFSWPCISTYET